MDFINALCELVNRSGLPAFVLVDILERTLKELSQMSASEYQRDLGLYNEKKGAVSDVGQDDTSAE